MFGNVLTKISKKSIEEYLAAYCKKPIKITEYSELGSGWVATDYKVKYEVNSHIKQIAIRTLKPIDFSHDYPSDRAAYFLLQHESAKTLPNHIESLGVIGVNEESGKITEISGYNEFFQILEWATGHEYQKDLEGILIKNTVSVLDKERVLLLSNYLVKIHSEKLNIPDERRFSLYKRHSRDYVGSIFLMDVLDTYPQDIQFTSWDNIYKFVNDIYIYIRREELKYNHNRLKRIHGDFHPGNIRFLDNGDISILDASRVLYGEPADDLASILINYIWYAFKQTNEFKGDFRKLFEIFWNNYLDRTGDKDIIRFIPLFLCVRSVIFTHPIFFNISDTLRRKIFDFFVRIINLENFDLKQIG